MTEKESSIRIGADPRKCPLFTMAKIFPNLCKEGKCAWWISEDIHGHIPGTCSIYRIAFELSSWPVP